MQPLHLALKTLFFPSGGFAQLLLAFFSKPYRQMKFAHVNKSQ